mmetsp:Transcript_48667/g.136050  ORF Transcript_48667/g.136050 Transcript_48667/m.136050 type:complete len:200 (-) Transcript_48667:2105-2704(-)
MHDELETQLATLGGCGGLGKVPVAAAAAIVPGRPPAGASLDAVAERRGSVGDGNGGFRGGCASVEGLVLLWPYTTLPAVPSKPEALGPRMGISIAEQLRPGITLLVATGWRPRVKLTYNVTFGKSRRNCAMAPTQERHGTSDTWSHISPATSEPPPCKGSIPSSWTHALANACKARNSPSPPRGCLRVAATSPNSQASS